MLFTATVPIPANTLSSAPLVERIPVHPGIVKRIWVRWRWGTANLAGCRILREEFQLWPLTPQQWFISSIYPLEFDEEYVLSGEPLFFTLEAYNEDDLFSHTLWVAIEVMLGGVAGTVTGAGSIWR